MIYSLYTSFYFKAMDYIGDVMPLIGYVDIVLLNLVSDSYVSSIFC